MRNRRGVPLPVSPPTPMDLDLDTAIRLKRGREKSAELKRKKRRVQELEAQRDELKGAHRDLAAELATAQARLAEVSTTLVSTQSALHAMELKAQHYEQENASLRAEVAILTAKLRDTIPRFSASHILEVNERRRNFAQHCTGLAGPVLNTFLRAIKAVGFERFWTSKTKPPKLSAEDALTLVKLRRNVPYDLLGPLFGVSQTGARRCFMRNIRALSYFQKTIFHRASPQLVEEYR